MNDFSVIEKEKNISLPEIYKQFFLHCSISRPENLIGIDILNNDSDLNKWAVELLEEDGVENFLSGDDVVFMMHQGYIFWYFKADGNPDPIVYGYHEKEYEPKILGNFSHFIKEYIN